MKAKITKKDGTVIELEGSVEEIGRIVEPPAPQFTLKPQAPATDFTKLMEELTKKQAQPYPDPPYWPYPQITFHNDMCSDGGAHSYPTVWMSVSPPSCEKCGKQSRATTTITCQTNEGRPFATSGFLTTTGPLLVAEHQS